MNRHNNTLWFVALIVLVLAVCGWFWETASTAPFAYDESDYVYAGSQGVWANYVDKGALSFFDFVAKGLELAGDSSQRSSISQYIRSQNDISFYRHYHGPLYAYWLGLWWGAGIRDEGVLRASNLVIHGLTTLLIFILFQRAFPNYPKGAAFIAAAASLLNRSELVTSTVATQHIFFQSVTVLALLCLAIHLQTGKRLWWHLSAAFLGVAFAAVESAIILLATLLVTVTWICWGKWRELRSYLMSGLLSSVVALTLVWPKAVLQLDIVKGYLYLAYIAVYRKTFSPIGPLELWGFRLRTYPWEFAVPLVALAAAFYIWRTRDVRKPLTPVLLYPLMFLGVTVVVTAPYTHYHGSLWAAGAILVGVMYGELAKRSGAAVQGVLGLVVMAPMLVSAAGFHREALEARGSHSHAREILNYLASKPISAPVFVTYTMVPTLHLYRPEMKAVGFDNDWPVQRLADETLAANAQVLCAASLCDQLERVWPAGSVLGREPVGTTDDTKEAVFAIAVQRP